MSRDFDDIYKKIDQSHKELYKTDYQLIKEINAIEKDQEKILSEIKDVKKEAKNIAFKVDMILDILNSFTIMLSEDDEDLEENYTSSENDSYLTPEQEEDWNTYDDEDDEESEY